MEIGCNICDRKEFEPVFATDEFKVIRCKACRLMFQPETHEYMDDYYTGEHKSYFSYGKARPECVNAFEKIKIHNNPGKLLDLGCGTGEFLEYAIDRGWDAEGVELSDHCSRICEEKGLSVTKYDVLDFETKERYDVITMFDALDHFPNPSKVIGRAKGWLKNNGVIVLTVDNHDQPFDFIRNKLFTKHHLYFFTPTTMMYMAGKHNLYCSYYLDNIPWQVLDKGRNLLRISQYFVKMLIVCYLTKKGVDSG